MRDLEAGLAALGVPTERIRTGTFGPGQATRLGSSAIARPGRQLSCRLWRDRRHETPSADHQEGRGPPTP
jgi:hypothetical protein